MGSEALLVKKAGTKQGQTARLMLICSSWK